VRSEIVLGKHSGRHALRSAFAELGHVVEGDELRRAFARFKEIADRKKHVTSADLEALLDDQARGAGERYRLDRLTIHTSTGAPARAAVRVLEGERALEGEATGDGPIDATFRAIEAAIGSHVVLAEFGVDAVTGGPDALGEVRVVVRAGDRSFAAQGLATDIAEASALAFLRAASLAAAAAEAAPVPLETT
jgi:2-isopropylmalate synthase